MVKKSTGVVIEELPSDSGNEDYFDENGDFSFDEDEDEDAAPETVNLKDAKLRYEKVATVGKSSKSKAVSKKNKAKKG